MSLTVETGAGIAGAESYASVAAADAFWSGRAHNALSATWTAASTANKEGALREATAHLDAAYGSHYRGQRRGYLQGLLWPRTGAMDEAGYELPALPQELVNAVCELAARAVSAPLAADVSTEDAIKRLKAGSVELEFVNSTSNDVTYGTVGKMLATILDGTQPGAPVPSWNWL